MLTPIHQRSDQ